MPRFDRIWYVMLVVLLLPGVLFGSAPGEAVSLPEEHLAYDVVVVGAGTGGTMAAIQGARMGARVALVEESGWIGGQMTGAAVSTMDDVRRNRSGIYGEFLARVREYYAKSGTPVNTCYWGSDTIAFEPRAGEEILYEMIREIRNSTLEDGSPGVLDVYLRCRLKDGFSRENRLEEIAVEQDLKLLRFRASVFIDATECGDLLPLTPARYRAGNSISPFIREDANIQDITWVAVIRKDPSAPSELRMTDPPESYHEDLSRFEQNVSLQGKTWPRGYPVDIPSFNAYRGLPDPRNDLPIDCGKPQTWPNITKTGMNWTNDYPGRGGYFPGLSVRYLEDREYRKDVDTRALLRTLAFLHYYQNDLEQPWTVDTSQEFDRGAPVGDLRTGKRIPQEYHPVTVHFPPFPYVRESRRLVGLKTLTVEDLERHKETGRAYRNFPSSIALGEYPVDIHGSHLDEYMEHDLGESAADFPVKWIPSKGVFQVPLECLIPESAEGLLGAEKNISVSRLVNGATRLQPITMLTGQAAGALAALAAQYRLSPREVPPLLVQDALWNGNSRLSMYSYQDVPQEHPLWKAVQDATLYEYLPGLSKSYFGLLLPLTETQGMAMLNGALESRLESTNPRKILSLRDFGNLFVQAGGSPEILEGTLLSDRDISREIALSWIFEERLRRAQPR